MNASKKNIMSGGWILCPSKTFPGKFYYFNVLNGETAWSLSDSEKKIIKAIPKVQESHHHPEPTSPPTEPIIPKFSHQHPKPIFGQSVFPKVLSKPEPYKSVLWTPIPFQVPIAVPPEIRIDDKSKPLPKVKQKIMWDFNNNLFIHTCDKPLSKRFVNFENPVINFDEDNKIQNKLQFDEFYMSTSEVNTKTMANNVTQKKSLSFSDLRPQRQLIKEAVFNIELPSETPEVKQIEPKFDSKEVDFGNMKLNHFGGDLRNLLMAKKRKSQVMNSEEVESKKLKTLPMETTPKKKVSFNFDYEDVEFYDNDLNFREKYSPTIEILRNLSRTVVDEWCIVVDGEMLLDEFSFLDKFVQLDPHCKLVIPSTALSCVRAASRGACATAARSVLRRLDAPYIIVQSDNAGISSNDDKIKSCVDAMYRNMHVVLISKNIELLAKVKCYPIHCYHVRTIKNGLAPKPEYKQNMKITIRNTEANMMKNSPSENLVEDLNEGEKESFKIKQNKVNFIGNECKTPIDSSNKISLQMNTISSQNMNNIEGSKINSISHLFNTTKEIYNSKKDENISKMLTDWRYAESDNTETTIEMDFQNLNLKDKYQTTHQKDKLNRNVSYFTHSTPNMNFNNRTPMFQNGCKNVPDSIFEIQKSNFKTMFQNNGANENSNLEIQKSNYKTAFFQNGLNNVQDSNLEVQNSNLEPSLFQIGQNVQDSNFEVKKSTPQTSLFQRDRNNVQDSNLEVQNSNFEPNLFRRGRNVQDSNFEIQTSNFKTPIFQTASENIQDSSFEFQKSKEPQSENIENENNGSKIPNKPNWAKRSNYIDLSNFYVKNQVMNIRLKERMDEFVCTYKQIMEEFLSSILEKLSPSAFKSMAPPWSLYEALQCAKSIYKDHIIVKNIIDFLIGFLYESDCKKDKIKVVITTSEFLKAVGCGLHLIQYLKNVLQPSPEILDSEKNLKDMINQIENPVYDINEPLVKTPVDINADNKEIRQNFVKNRTDIISYLKKHYSDWQNYKEIDNKMKIVRTFGRNLNMLKLERVREVAKTDALNNDVVKNVERLTNDVGKASIECTKVTTLKDTTKHFGVFVMNEVDIAMNVESEKSLNIVQEKCNKIKNNQNETLANLDGDSRNDGIDKPKTKSIFDFVIPKDKNQENRKEKLLHSDILGFKITIPNKEILKDCINKDIERKCGRKLNINIKDDITKEIYKNNENIDSTDIKIIRNIHLIEEFERRLNDKAILDNLEYSSISSTYTDNETNANVKVNDQIDDHTRNLESSNQMNTQNEKNLNDKHYEDKTRNISNDIKINELKEPNENNSQNIGKNCVNDPKSDGNDPKSDPSERKTYKDDMTTDSGLGNESPRHSVVKFSCELESSFEHIRTYIDGSLEEFRQGKLNEETKNTFRLKAFETNFLITRIISRLNKLVQSNCEVSSEKNIQKNTVVSKCLEQAEVLQKALNMILTVTNESPVELNSSMSLNLS